MGFFVKAGSPSEDTTTYFLVFFSLRSVQCVAAPSRRIGKRKKVVLQLLQLSISALLSGLGSALCSALYRVSGRHAAIGVLAVSISQSAAIVKAQTIQLPAFQQRGVRTTVVVPDRGSITLGGF